MGALALFGSAGAYGQTNLDHPPSAVLTSGENPSQVRLKLVDGSNIVADEAWESEQGIWYRRGGMSHLVSRERVKTIERGSISRPKPDVQVAKVVVSDNSDNRADGSHAADGSDDQPVWIYLVGGARFEADSVARFQFLLSGRELITLSAKNWEVWPNPTLQRKRAVGLPAVRRLTA
jgi:hypothetical protein